MDNPNKPRRVRIERLLTREEVNEAIIAHYGFANVNAAERMLVDQTVEIVLEDGTDAFDDDVGIYVVGHAQVAPDDLERAGDDD